MSLHIYLLGPMRILHGKTVIPESAWKIQKNKTLFKILLTFRHRALTKDQLVEWLWPELAPAAANRNLRVAVSQVRQVLEPRLAGGAESSYLLTTDVGYAWNLQAAYWLDVDEFNALCTDFEKNRQVATGEQARALYRGDYLEEDRYADWAAAPREQLRERYQSLLTQLAEAYAWQGRYRRAIALCRELLTNDSLRESVWCQLMLYYYHGGDQALALRAYEECRQALREELGVEPMPETTRLLEELRGQTLAPRHAYPRPAVSERLREFPVSWSRLPFVGRENEFAALAEAWETARAGHGGAVVVEGETGIGKTRLVRELLEYARSQGATILEGKCRELERALPYQPLVDSLRSGGSVAPTLRAQLNPVWWAELARLVPEWSTPETQSVPTGSDPGRLFEALARYLFARAGSGGGNARGANGVVLFLDDLHWADQTTLEFLAYLVHRLAEHAILLVCTVRPEEIGAPSAVPTLLHELDRAGPPRWRVVLEPLPEQTVAQLIRDVSHDSPAADRLSGRLYRETRGHPLYLVALLHSLFETGLLQVDEQGRWRADEYASRDHTPPLIPREVTDLIQARVRQFDMRAQRLLALAAVIGRPCDLALLQEASGADESSVLDAADYLVERRLFRIVEHTSTHEYDLSHDLVRGALYQELSPDRCALLHRNVLAALERIDSRAQYIPAGELAYHALRGHVWSKAPDYCRRAASLALERYALPETLQACEEGLGALDHARNTLDARRALELRYDLLADKQLALHLLGRRDRAILDELMGLARTLGDRERLAQAYAALMRYLIDTGQNQAALDLVPVYAPIVAAEVRASTAIGFHQRVGFLYYRAGDLPRALEHHDEGLRLAEAHGDAHWQAYVLNTRGTVLLCLGRYEEAIADWTRAIALWDGPARRLYRTFAVDNRGDVYYYLGRYQEQLEAKQQALPVYREFAYPIAEAECLSEMGICLLAMGRLDEATNNLTQALELCRSLQDSYDLVQTLNGLARLYLEQDRAEAWRLAEDYAVQAAAEAERATLPHGVIQGLALQARAVLRLGSPEAALPRSTRAVTLLSERKYMDGAEEEIYWIHSRVLAANRQADAARAFAQQAYAEMMSKAERLTDPALRQSFFECVAVNRAIRDSAV